MILLLAVVLGLIAGCARALVAGRGLQGLTIQRIWLVVLALSLQLPMFQRPLLGSTAWGSFAPAILVASQAILLYFAWSNRTLPGFPALGLGLLLNLLVITVNGGLMPISPETVAALVPEHVTDEMQPGERLGTTKDVILPVDQTRLAILSDRLLLPSWFPYRAALSLGDLIISAGAFQLLWALGRAQPITRERVWDSPPTALPARPTAEL